MNSLPLISHRLFAAAIHDDYGLRRSPSPSRLPRPNSDPAVIPLEPVKDELSPRPAGDSNSWRSSDQVTES